MTGLHSVCPNAVTTSACGNVSIIVRSRVVDAGAAPQEIRRRCDRSRSAMPGTATTAAHMAGTRKMLDDPLPLDHVEGLRPGRSRRTA